MTGYASHIIREHFGRTGQPPPGALDASYQYQMGILRETLTRLEVVLEDEGIEPAKVERVLRCMLYGAPSAAEAGLRMDQAERMTELAQRVPAGMEIPLRRSDTPL